MLSLRTIVSCALALVMGACAFAASSSAGSATNVTVSAAIASTVTIGNGCTTPAATAFPMMTPGSSAVTNTGAQVCRIDFGSNSSAQLRISQKDGTGDAMRLGIEAPTELARDLLPGRTLGAFSPDGTYGWLVGRQQTMYRTLNAGAFWGSSITKPYGNFNDVETVPGSPATVWVVGDNRYIACSTNGMAAGTVNFSDMRAGLVTAGWPAAVNINEITIPTSTKLMIVGDDRWIGILDLGTSAWTVFQHSDTSVGNIVSVDALDANRIMAATDTGRILRTTTGGANSAAWSVSTAPGTAPIVLQDIAMGSATRAYVVGERGYAASWDGASWTDRTASIAVAWDLVGVDSMPGSPDSIIALDERDGIFRSADMGATWQISSVGSSSRAGDIHAATATMVFTASAERSFGTSSDGGATWALDGPVNSETLMGVDVSPTNGQRVIAVGASTRTSTDGGASWTTRSNVGGSLNAVSMASDTSGWAVGDNARIRRTDDFAATWSVQSPPAGVTTRLHDVTALSSDRAVAVGDAGVVLLTFDGGATWKVRPSVTTVQLSSVDSNGDLVIAVGARGTVIRSTDAGDTWSTVPAGALPVATAQLVGVSIARPQLAVAATAAGTVWTSSDDGATWTQTAAATGIRARSIAASGSTIIVAGVNNDTSLSTDGGASWSTVRGAAGMHLLHVVAVDSHTAFVAGADAIRMKFDTTTTSANRIPDWTSGSNDWTTNSFFGVCLQNVGGIAAADWTRDTANTPGQCEQLVTDPWRAVPATSSTVAHTAAPGTGSVDLVWGMRIAPGQAPGAYEATIAFEALAP